MIGALHPLKKKISTYPNTILIDWTDKIDRVFGYKTIKNLRRYVESGGTVPFIFVQREYLYNQKLVFMLDCANRGKGRLKIMSF